MDKIKQKCFAFLWSGVKKGHYFHLLNQEKITSPKPLGGWALKNILKFDKAMAAQSLWSCMWLGGIWGEIIMDKYLKNNSVEDWCRSEGYAGRLVSNIWNSLASAFPVIKEWLAWRVGNGHKVLCG